MDKRSDYDTSDESIILKYERLLSPYGRKVMSTLLNIKKERIANNVLKPILNPPMHYRDRNKTVISFNGCETLRTLPITNDVVTENSVNITTSEFNFQNRNINNGLSLVSSSNDFRKSPYNYNIGVTTENVCHTNVLSYDNNSHAVQKYSYTDSIYETSDNISWDNMIDVDTLQCLEEADVAEKNYNKNKEFQSDDNNEKSKFEYNKRDVNTTEKVKRKTKNSNAVYIKAKTNVSIKNHDKVNFRKEKYTTTIKNWLDDINTKNIVDENEIEPQCIDHQNQESGNLNNMTGIEEQKKSKPEINKIFNKEKKNKRSIQAQLANKDGVMKYKKPKITADVINTENIHTESDSNNNISELINSKVVTKYIKESNRKAGNAKKTKSKLVLDPLRDSNTASEVVKDPNTKVVQEKKGKAKFVAPIKSQIPVKDVTYNVVIINSLIDISAVLSQLEKIDVDQGVMTLVYSNGFSQLNRQHTDDTCSPEGIMFCFRDIFYYFEGHVEGTANVLCRILSGNTLVSFDAKSVLVYLMCQYDLMPDSLHIIDTKIGSSLIRPDEPPENFSEMQKLLGFRAEYTIATDCTLQKVAWYMTILKECSDTLKCLLLEQGLWKVFADIEMKILPVMTVMEHRGISVDTAKLKSMEDILMTRLKEIEGQCHESAGKVFQINSTAQVRALIYDELKLDTASNVKIRETISKGAKSTSEAMLRSLLGVHPLPQLILEYRHLHKAHATFLAGIAQHVRDGVVKPTWDQTAAATGRVASNNPNLQAIPKMPFNLVLFPNDDDNDTQTLNFRSVYGARPGYSLLAADFKHIECRVFAHAAADSGLLSALESPDLFRVLAARWLNKPESAVSPADRERTKRIVYASLYGAGTRKLMEILNLGYDQVLSIMSTFNRTFPSLKSFGRSVVAQCARQQGRLTTASGRARTFPNITSNDFQAKSHAERQAVNFIIQGTAADLCKVAMVLATARLRQGSLPATAHLLLQIHDELVWEVLDPHLDTAAAIIKNAMESCGEVFGMPRALPVAMCRGPNWGEMEPFLPGT